MQLTPETICHDCCGPDDGNTCDTCGMPLCHECRIRYTDGTEAECERCMGADVYGDAEPESLDDEGIVALIGRVRGRLGNMKGAARTERWDVVHREAQTAIDQLTTICNAIEDWQPE